MPSPEEADSNSFLEEKQCGEANSFTLECLLDQILIRLPVKSVFRLKSVHKKWLSETLSPSFISSYCRSQPPPWTLLYQFPCPGHTLENHRLDRLYSLEDNMSLPQLSVVQHSWIPDHDVLKIVAESNGLLCCKPYGINEGRYRICNPITKQWVILPPNNAPARCRSKGKKTYAQFHPASTFRPYYASVKRPRQEVPDHASTNQTRQPDDIEGFIALVEDGVCTQYKLVVPVGHRRGSAGVHGLDIFCYETGVWIRLEIELPFPLYSASLSKPVALGGKLHWPNYFKGVLLVYDPFGDEAHVVQLPDGRSDIVHSRMCGVSDGLLQYYEMADHTHAVKVWELADSTSGQWLVKHQVSWSGVWSKDELLSASVEEPSDFRFYPIAFHPFDSDVVYLHNSEYLIYFNIRAMKLGVLCEPNSSFGESFRWKMLPVVLPSWPTSLPRPFWQEISSLAVVQFSD